MVGSSANSISSLPVTTLAWFPSPVSNIVAIVTSSTDVSLSYDLGSSNGSPVVSCRAIPNPVAPVSNVNNNPFTSILVSNLTPGTIYTFAVICSNSVGDSTPATSNSVEMWNIPATPINVLSTVIDSNTIQVDWTVPSDGGVALDDCTIAATNGGMQYVHAITTNVDHYQPIAVEVTINAALSPYTDYSFYVTCSNSIGPSLNSSASTSVRTLPSVPDAPTLVSATVLSSSEVQVEIFVASASIHDASLISCQGVGIPNDNNLPPQTQSTYFVLLDLPFTLSIANLIPGASYTFQVSCTNSVGTSLPSLPFGPVTLWNVPSISVISSVDIVSSTSGVVTFDLTAGSNGQPVSQCTVNATWLESFNVYSQNTNDVETVSVTAAMDSATAASGNSNGLHPIRLTELSPGSYYAIIVSCMNFCWLE